MDTKDGKLIKGSRSRTWNSWYKMTRRCDLERATEKERRQYASRGIKVDPSWETYEQFVADMGFKPSNHHTIDRIDNERGYCKDNCRWATPEQQNNNKSDNIRITMGGECLTLSQWCTRLGFDARQYDMIKHRIADGWTVESALLTPNTRSHHGSREDRVEVDCAAGARGTVQREGRQGTQAPC